MSDPVFKQIMDVITVLTPIVTAIILFVPRLWEKSKFRADTVKITAEERETMARAGTVLIDASVEMVNRLKEEIAGYREERVKMNGVVEKLQGDFEKCKTLLQEKMQALEKMLEEQKETNHG